MVITCGAARLQLVRAGCKRPVTPGACALQSSNHRLPQEPGLHTPHIVMQGHSCTSESTLTLP